MRMIAGTKWAVEDARRYIEDRVMIVPWSGCWLWERSLTTTRYGVGTVPIPFRAERTPTMLMHRLAYEAFVGPIPEHDSFHGMCVCHKCDVPECVNPDHLFLGVHRENMHDRDAKGRGNRGARNGMAKLSPEDVRQIYERAHAGERQRVIAADYGIGERAVSKIKTGIRWRHVLSKAG
jgi:hypothetical protein